MIFLALPGVGYRRTRVILLLLTFFTCPASWAAFGFKLDGSLDKEAISHSYFESDFARILPPLEMYRQSFPATATREDSIFVYKYLSVIYAADSSTRSRAESYMVQLLKLMPTIELIDLYISDNIQAIFRNVKQNYLEQQKYVREHDSYGRPLTDSTKPRRTTPSKASSKQWVWWTLGGLGTTVAAATTFYILQDDPQPKAYSDRVKP